MMNKADLSEKSLQKRQESVDKCLSKITVLQEQLKREEQKLIQLLQEYGTGILPSS